MPVLISFSGIDGAGKTTLLLRLRAHLRDIGVPTEVVSFWDDVAVFSRLRETTSQVVFKGDSGIGSPECPVERRDKNVRAWYVTFARLFLYWVDTLNLSWLVRSHRQRAGVLLFDRYVYDELANLPLERWPMRVYLRFVLFFAPRPDLPYILDADPVEARRRKPEYPIEFLHHNRQAYLDLATVADLILIQPDHSAAVLGHATQLIQRGLYVETPRSAPDLRPTL